MTDTKQTALKAKITRARNRLKGADCTLAEKLELKRKVKDAEGELRQWRLNIYAKEDGSQETPT